jgi:hypothetical protein
MNKKTTTLSTEVFKNKKAPEFIVGHPLFRQPVKIKKVFPSIGLHNFKQKVNIEKPLFDLRKEGSFVITLLNDMFNILNQLKTDVEAEAENLQFGGGFGDPDSKSKIAELGELCDYVIPELVKQTNPNEREVLSSTVRHSSNKIALKLFRNIVGKNEKVIYPQDKSLFQIFNKLKEQADKYGINMRNIDQLDSFKTFSKENIPNKEYSVVFSSNGEEGAWDLATMSMRGITSCQKWDGQHKQCLVGSILSKFVGVMYLTSGVDFEANGIKFGSKMLRRSLVRYVVDAITNKPCIVIDKMYPEYDKDIAKVFIETLKSKTGLDVYYTTEITNELKVLYTPREELRGKIEQRERSYLDTPIKYEEDLKVQSDANKEEMYNREIAFFKNSFSIFLNNKFFDVIEARDCSLEQYKILNNINISSSIHQFTDHLVTYIFEKVRNTVSRSLSRTEFNRKYLHDFFKVKKVVKNSLSRDLAKNIRNFTSRDFNLDKFSEFVVECLAEFNKAQVKRIFN